MMTNFIISTRVIFSLSSLVALFSHKFTNFSPIEYRDTVIEVYQDKGHLIGQIMNFCSTNNITSLYCADFFADIIIKMHVEGINLPIPLHEEKVMIGSEFINFEIRLHNGSLFHQIEAFCSTHKCGASGLKAIKSIFTQRHRKFWFPKGYISLDMIQSMNNVSMHSYSMDKVLEPSWNKLAKKIHTYIHSKKNMKKRIAKIEPNHNRIFYTIFSGRKEFMNIHLTYTDMLLDANLVHEVHIWDFAPFLQSYELADFIRLTPRDGYRLFRRPPKDNNIKSPLNQGYRYQSYYDHYSNNQRYQSNDIIIKADDDIVYLDILSFEKFINNITFTSIHFPNIVNNDVTFVIQAKRGVHPLLHRFLIAYESTGVDLSERMYRFMCAKKDVTDYTALKICPLTALYCKEVVNGTWWGSTYESGIMASGIHNIFLQDPYTYAMKSRNGVRYVRVGRRISLNMFGLRISLFREAFSQFLTHTHCCDDEGYVGKWPSMSRHKHYIDTHFTVTHFSFGPQRDNYYGNMSYDLSQYLSLAKMLSSFEHNFKN